MMRRSAIFLVFAAFVLQGGSCGNTTPWIGVECSNDIDGTAFGFTLSVPDDFECIDAYPQPAFLVFDRLRQSGTGNIASIVVGPPAELATGDGISLDELDTTSNSNGVTARRFHQTATSQGTNVVSYFALIDLPGESELSIAIVNTSEASQMLSSLDAILATVVLTHH
jgi:hypothetical protein